MTRPSNIVSKQAPLHVFDRAFFMIFLSDSLVFILPPLYVRDELLSFSAKSLCMLFVLLHSLRQLSLSN